MPKMKSHGGAKKRFRFTATGKAKRQHSHKNHILTKKRPDRIRKLRGTIVASKPDQKRIEKRRAVEAVRHAWMHAYIGRKQKKRTMRRLWIVRVNAAARSNGLSYSRFIEGCQKAKIGLDRKVLADLAVADPAAFGKVVEVARGALSA